MTSKRIITQYAPDVYKALDGIVLFHKPANMLFNDFLMQLRNNIVDDLHILQPRPLSSHLVYKENEAGELSILEKPNLADHPLVVGPRYVPWELSLLPFKPLLKYRTSGVTAFAIGAGVARFHKRIRYTKLVNVYHLTGRFGYITDNFFSDGKIMDKSTFKHITASRIDTVLSRIETSQQDRLFDSANVPLDSQEAYELAKSWPSRPAQMAGWPVIYRIRCIHFKLPYFKLEVTITNEQEHFMAQLCHEVGLMLKSGAFTESIRRVKQGPFSIDDSLTDREWRVQSILNNIEKQRIRIPKIDATLRQYSMATPIRQEYSTNGSRYHEIQNKAEMN